MFETISLAINDGRIQQAWNKLIRKIQTDVEHKRVWNAAPAPAVRGMVMYAYDGNRTVAPALATVPGAAAEWVGVMSEPMAGSASGGQGVMRYQGLAYVRLDNGLNPAGGNPVYVSAVNPGNASTVDANAGAYRLGTIADATGYVSVQTPFAWVWLGRCCSPYDTSN